MGTSTSKPTAVSTVEHLSRLSFWITQHCIQHCVLNHLALRVNRGIHHDESVHMHASRSFKHIVQSTDTHQLVLFGVTQGAALVWHDQTVQGSFIQQLAIYIIFLKDM